MKSIQSIYISLFFFCFLSCAQAPDADKATVKDAVKTETKKNNSDFYSYTLDTEKSTVNFIGTNPVDQHKGFFKLSSGNISFLGDEIKGGNLTVDVTSLEITSLKGDKGSQLKGHLLSDDFFKAETHPHATFNISKVIPIIDAKETKLVGATHLVSGNLRLLDRTKSVSFPAKISANGKEFTAIADFNINRTDWGMAYGNDKSLGDRFIRPEVNIKFELVGQRR